MMEPWGFLVCFNWIGRYIYELDDFDEIACGLYCADALVDDWARRALLLQSRRDFIVLNSLKLKV